VPRGLGGKIRCKRREGGRRYREQTKDQKLPEMKKVVREGPRKGKGAKPKERGKKGNYGPIEASKEGTRKVGTKGGPVGWRS